MKTNSLIALMLIVAVTIWAALACSPTESPPTGPATDNAGLVAATQETSASASEPTQAPQPSIAAAPSEVRPASSATATIELPPPQQEAATVAAAAESTLAPAVAAVGTGIGETAPRFAVHLTDGTEISSEQLLEPGRPVFMIYFATW